MRGLGLSVVLVFVTFSGAAFAFDPIVATDSVLAQIPKTDETRVDAYYEGGYWLDLWSTLVDLAIAFVILHFGWSAAWRDRSQGLVKRKWLLPIIFAPIYLAVSSLLALPFQAYRHFFREHQYGLATQNFGGWIAEYGINIMVGMVQGLIFFSLLYWVIRRAPKTWWAWGAGLVAVFAIFLFTVQPIVVEPLTNEYTSMEEGALKDDILAMARANGMGVVDVFQVNESKQHNRISANVAGAFGTARIALNDNLLERASDGGVKAVMAHEMGHYLMNDPISLVLQLGILFAFGFLLASRVFNRIVQSQGERWGISDITDVAGLPLLLAIASVFFLLAGPIINTVFRTNEAHADLFAINVTQDPDALVEVLLLTSEYRKASPGVWEERLFYDHPSPRSRILMAMKWKAEHLGEDVSEVEVER